MEIGNCKRNPGSWKREREREKEKFDLFISHFLFLRHECKVSPQSCGWLLVGHSVSVGQNSPPKPSHHPLPPPHHHLLPPSKCSAWGPIFSALTPNCRLCLCLWVGFFFLLCQTLFGAVAPRDVTRRLCRHSARAWRQRSPPRLMQRHDSFFPNRPALIPPSSLTPSLVSQWQQ